MMGTGVSASPQEPPWMAGHGRFGGLARSMLETPCLILSRRSILRKYAQKDVGGDLREASRSDD